MNELTMCLANDAETEPPPRSILSVERRLGVLEVCGDVDLATAPALAAALGPLVAAGGRVWIDAHDVTFIGAAGLHVLADAADALADRGRVVLLDPSRVVVRALDLVGRRVGLDVVTSVHHDVA